MNKYLQFFNDLFTTGAKRFYNDMLDNTDSFKSKEERFMNRLVCLIHKIHLELRDNHYNEYRLSEEEVYDLQDAVFCKEYELSPMRLVSKLEQSQKHKHDYFETEGAIYHLPDVNKDNHIIRRFPSEVLIKSMPVYLHVGREVVSPVNLHIDNRTHYIKSPIEDNLVIAAFFLALILHLEDYPYFRETSYDNYYSTKLEVVEAYKKWNSLDKEDNLLFQLYPTKWLYSRSRLIEKMAPFVNSDKYLMSIIESIVNLPILDEAGKDYSSKKGSPFIPILDDVLFNIVLNDVDNSIEENLPQYKFIRLQSEIRVAIDKNLPISEKKNIQATLKELIQEAILPSPRV